MKFTLSWLKEHLDTDASLSEIVDAMTMAGLEVEEVIDPAAALSAFTVGHVLAAEKHPDADKLKVCRVATKDGEQQIVCGAPNAREGLYVAFAPLGTYIPGADFSLDKKPRKIRGIESFGMMCSADELDLGEDSDGIIELPKAEVGAPIADVLGLNDPVIDFEVTPNRPDWLGVRGIARDLAAAGIGTLKPDTIEPVQATIDNAQSVLIEAPDACPAFVGRVVRGLKNGPSPKWLQDKLKAIGLRPISALVDITNFMTIDRARPLHVYDLAKVEGSIIVRMGEDETFEALDDKTYTATADDVVIADERGILGLGGIVGGESSGVSDETADILIECAVFDPLTIRRSAKRLGVNSDAKYRFERGIDTGFMRDGMEMATRLVLDLCGGDASTVDVAGAIPAEPEPVTFDPARVEQLLGFTPGDDEILRILDTLGFKKTGSDVPWPFAVPTWRRDVTMQADLVEEVARIAGFDQLPATSLPAMPGRREPTATLTQTRTRLARRALALRGLSETVSWSFVLDTHADAFGGGDAALYLDNPISSDLNVMRPSALIHLLLSGQKATDRGYPGAALFELGPVYRGTEPGDQSLTLAGIRRVEPGRDWAGADAITALSAKADALAALDAMGANTDNLQLSKPTGDYWHPGRSGRLQMGPKNILADFGELHPRVLKALGIDGRVVAFEVWPESLPAPRNKAKGKKSASKSKGALALSDLMPVHRDFAFIVPDTLAAGDLVRAAKGADKALISDVSLFDIYTGKGIEDGHKSLAIDVTLSPRDETLTDSQIETISAKIVKAAEKLGAQLRG
ncbi:phenylalanine--tRNA ligase beta subunit [Algimonas ampicilliniresistens]|uniref:Phenylalanine--tRNA ligase beta subunit n=1 Tax=Algimonas ampicilliniresistens TaxID=1298735 RepID=A0ABQ5V905_9PROT|nr:phenylalanine--tRNA ligase subunit beta [Algimonas ampicilliniresistens]GLQ23938.1 phenylalanine--tRNA ligase beta subunit [Algimonas ampicilliniresistens]